MTGIFLVFEVQTSVASQDLDPLLVIKRESAWSRIWYSSPVPSSSVALQAERGDVKSAGRG
jgi:hypothetical protein